ncbi:hypothetical protein R3P38DRAFT_2417759, partial [Favolaschia claudopus]
SPDDWLLDSACTRSIARNKQHFTSYLPCEHVIEGFGKSNGIGRGTISLSAVLGSSTRACTIRDVIHCPDAPFNLISLARITDAGYHAKFVGDLVEIRSEKGHLVAIGDKVSHMYRLRV